MKKKSKKLLGVTLLELVIVMAIFSAIAAGAMAMVRPAMQIHYKTAAQEKAVAAVDTMARFIQDNLRYADKMFVFTNHGIKDNALPDTKAIDIFQDYPFGYENFKNEIDFISQKREEYTILSGETIEVLRGKKDVYCYANPVSAFLQYYLEESVYHDDTKTEAEKINYFNDYFKDKVIYVMEIKDTGEINIYSYPLKGWDLGLSIPLIWGEMKYTEATRPCSSLVTSVGEDEKPIKIDKIEIGDDPSKGLNVELSIEYKGATTPLKLNYNMAVNFMNISSSNDMLNVNDKYPYKAKKYMVFNWKDAERVVSEREDEASYFSPSRDERKIEGNEGYTYIVYSLPEIIP